MAAVLLVAGILLAAVVGGLAGVLVSVIFTILAIAVALG